jgi:hypothetical protein
LIVTYLGQICPKYTYALLKLEDAFAQVLSSLALHQLFRHKRILGNIQRVKIIPLTTPGFHFRGLQDWGHSIYLSALDAPREQLDTLLHEVIEIHAESGKRSLTKDRASRLTDEEHQAVEDCAVRGAPFLRGALCCFSPFGVCL